VLYILNALKRERKKEGNQSWENWTRRAIIEVFGRRDGQILKRNCFKYAFKLEISILRLVKSIHSSLRSETHNVNAILCLPP